MTDTAPADHRYIQVARALRKEIVDGVYPGRAPSCRPNTNCVNDFRSAATPCGKRCAGCAKTTSSRRGRGPAPSSCRDPRRTPTRRHVDQRPAGLRNRRPIRDRIHRAWSRVDDDVAARTGLGSGEQWLAVRGFRQAEGADFPLCRTEYYINRAFAAVGRLLQRHTGPIFPLIEDLFGVSIVEVHQEIAAVLIAPALADGLKIEPGRPRWKCSAHTRRRTARSRRSRSTPIPHRVFVTR